MKKRWAVFISGRGSNLLALLKSSRSSDIICVVSSKKNAGGVFYARRAGIPVEVLARPIDWLKLTSKLRARGVTHIFLAGFMKVLPEEFVEAWDNRILNIHPSLLPKYPGLKSIERAFQDGAELGATVHEVIADVDKGAIVMQASIGASDRFSSLEEAEFWLHRCEHRIVQKSFERWQSYAVQ